MQIRLQVLRAHCPNTYTVPIYLLGIYTHIFLISRALCDRAPCTTRYYYFVSELLVC